MLNVVEAPIKRRRGRPPLTAEQKAARKALPAPLEAPPAVSEPVVEAQPAPAGRKRLLGACGFLLGAFVPLASYTVVHLEVESRPWMWILVAGGLVYSALSVYGWARRAFTYPAKAAGFVVLLEGTLTLSQVPWLSLAGLGILMVLNGATAAVALGGREC